MRLERHLFLVGFMGSGKSTVARLIAGVLGAPLIDLDERISHTAGRSIAQVFAADGEEAFRDLESAELARTESETPSVVACGGGVVLRPENRALLTRLGTVAYLHVTAGEAIARIGDAESRPLLSGPGAPLAATALLAARESLYRSIADFTVETVGRSAQDVADDVLIALGELS